MIGITTGKLYMYILSTLAILIAIGGLYYYINDLKNTILLCEEKIETLKSELATNAVILVNKDNVIDAKIDENKQLLNTIDKYNDIVSANEIALRKSKKDLNKWKSLAASEKFKYTNKLLAVDKVDYDKATCKEGLLLINKISKLDFNNLYKIKAIQ